MLDLYNYDSVGETGIENALSNAMSAVKPGSVVAAHASLRDKTETAKTCPKCGPATKLIIRTNKKDKSQFLGCPNYPECDYSEPLPESIKLELMGTPRLPGF